MPEAVIIDAVRTPIFKILLHTVDHPNPDKYFFTASKHKTLRGVLMMKLRIPANR